MLSLARQLNHLRISFLGTKISNYGRSISLPAARLQSFSAFSFGSKISSPVLSSSAKTLSSSFPSLTSSVGLRSVSTLSQVDSLRKFALDLHLGNLRDNPGARKKAKRVGRGPGSGRGKTAGRGMKGQKKRGGVPLGFEGGQSPFHLRIPKRGPKNPNRKPLEPLNLNRLQYWISTNRIDASKPITMKVLLDSGCVTRIKYGVKLLGNGSELLESKVDIEVSRASQSAIKAIEARGGKVTTRYFERVGLRLLLHPEKFNPNKIPRFASPTNAKDRDYYSNWENRGYLATPPSETAKPAAASKPAAQPKAK